MHVCQVTAVMSDSVWPYDCSLLSSLSMGFSRQERWSRLPSILQWIIPIQGSNPSLQHAGRFFTIWATREICDLDTHNSWLNYPVCKMGTWSSIVTRLHQGAYVRWFSLSWWKSEFLLRAGEEERAQIAEIAARMPDLGLGRWSSG